MKQVGLQKKRGGERKRDGKMATGMVPAPISWILWQRNNIGREEREQNTCNAAGGWGGGGFWLEVTGLKGGNGLVGFVGV